MTLGCSLTPLSPHSSVSIAPDFLNTSSIANLSLSHEGKKTRIQKTLINIKGRADFFAEIDKLIAKNTEYLEKVK
jgi:hypothetical protein